MKSRLITGALLGILLLLQYPLWFGSGSAISLWRLHRQADAQKQENARLEDRNQALAAEVIDLKQGLEAIEERARWDLGMVKKDEVFFRVVE